jgi:hypothetical protein
LLNTSAPSTTLPAASALDALPKRSTVESSAALARCAAERGGTTPVLPVVVWQDATGLEAFAGRSTYAGRVTNV